MADLDTLYAEIATNRDYASTGSIAKARALQSTLTELMLTRPTDGQFEDGRFAYAGAAIDKMLKRVDEWIAAYERAASGGGGVKHLSPSDWRGNAAGLGTRRQS